MMTEVTIHRNGWGVPFNCATLPSGAFFFYCGDLHLVVEWHKDNATVWNFSRSSKYTFTDDSKEQYFPQSSVDITAKQ